MTIIQLYITYDDIITAGVTTNGTTIQAVGAGDASYSIKPRLLRQVNLYAGKYKVKVDGFHISAGLVNVTSYVDNPQVITIGSSRFEFPYGGSKTLNFSTIVNNCMADLSGKREFYMNSIGGLLDIELSIQQFGQNINATVAAGGVNPPYNIDKTASWLSSGFAYLILTLEIIPMDVQAQFGNVKQIK